MFAILDEFAWGAARRPWPLAQPALFRRLRAGCRLALRPLGSADGRTDGRTGPRCGPGADGTGDVAHAVLPVLRRS